MATQPVSKPEAEDDATLRHVLDLQNDYFARIQAANATGNAAEVRQLVEDLERKVRTMALGLPRLTLVKDEHAVPLYDPSTCTLELATLAVAADRDAFAALKRETLPETHVDVEGELLRALRPAAGLVPKLDAAVAACRDRLGLKLGLDVRLLPDPQPEAFCYAPRNGKLTIAVTAGLVQRLESVELAFVLGHEIGRALLGHHAFHVATLLRSGVAPAVAVRLVAWERMAELSADRFGLVAARDVDAAWRALFKIATGLPVEAGGSEALREHVARLVAETPADAVAAASHVAASPFVPYRLKALDAFARSEAYLTPLGRDGDVELVDGQLELRLGALTAPLEPVLPAHEDAHAFALLAGAAAGKLDAIRILLGLPEDEPRLKALTEGDAAALDARLGEAGQVLQVKLSPLERTRLAEDLTVALAAAGGGLPESCRQALQVERSVVAQRLAAFTGG